MSLFKKLPSEIEDIIWSLYWMDIYKSSVIKHFNMINEKVIDLNENITLNIILNFTNEAKKLDHLNKYNNIILDLIKDNGTKKYSIILDKNLYYAFNINNSSYMQYKNLKNVTNYLVVKSGIMRYSAYHSIHV
tara:strand:+ start:236 stop:634 length:399 start_codon:yes stop_codon:yes gene_type:complete